MNKNPKVSVIMSTFNESEGWLKQAIESILKQTYSNLEFIIVLDNPQNIILNNVVKEYAQKDARIKIIKNRVNKGLTYSLNQALRYCTGEVIVRMDADDISESDRIEYQLKSMQANNVDILGGAVCVIDEEANTIKRYMKMPTDSKCIKKKMHYTNCLAHPTWMVKKSIYEKLDGYRDIPMCEDYDFLLRACKNGFRLDNVERVVLKYRMTQNSISRTNGLKQYLFMRGLQQNFDNLESINKEILEEQVAHQNTLEASKKYTKANSLFMKGNSYLEKGRYGIAIIFLLKAVFTSPHYFNKIMRMIMGLIM